MQSKLLLLVAGIMPPAIATGLAQPNIITQPTNHFADTASSFGFYVGAGGTAPLSYQWLFNGTAIAGATRSSLTVSTPQPAQWGYYSVVVTNLSGSVTSQVAELKIFGASRHSLSGMRAQADGSMILRFAGETTAAFGNYYDEYPLETSSNLVDWLPLGTLQRSNAALDPLQFADTNAAQFTQRYYRTPTNQLATPYLAPTGPYAVGTFSTLLTNTSRTNATFMTTFWYPAVAQAGLLPAKYVEPGVAQSGYYDYRPGGSDFSNQVAAFYSHSLPGVPLAATPSRFPVVLYDCGLFGHRRENTDKVEELASWGYVVVGLDTSDTYVSVFPDGRVVWGEYFDPWGASESQWSEILNGRVKDLQFVMDQLAVLNAGDPRLVGRLDLTRIGVFGWSLGGGTAAELCLHDPRCKAGAALDPLVRPDMLTRPLGVPWLLFRIDTGPDPDPGAFGGAFRDYRLQLYTLQPTNAYWARLASTVHGDFAEFGPILDPASLASSAWGTPLSGQFLNGSRVGQVLRAYLLAFFNKHLKGQDDHLLDGPSPAYPEVSQFLSTSTVSGVSGPPAYPKGDLVQGSDGLLYGTTVHGGSNNQGTIFRVTTNGMLTVLISFDGTNGSHPMAGLLQGSDGNFYGTTAYGGTTGNNGTVFQMTPGGVLTTLVSFTGTNGSQPVAGLIQGSNGLLYGTTVLGGASNLGTVFQMTTAGALTTLISFNGSNSRCPFGALTKGTNGNFYGTTTGEGAQFTGTLFEMTPAGALTRRAAFTRGNGSGPSAAILQGTNGFLYGTTEQGGNTNLNGGWGFGTVFKMTSAGALTTLVSFGGTNGSCCVSSLVQGSDGNFYGTTAGGGLGATVTGGGTVFKMTPAGALTTLVSFNDSNGSCPQASLVQASDGNFYGTTAYGGPHRGGTVFRVTPAGVLTTLVAF